MEPNTTTRAAKVAKITALLQKTVARGCTPAEEAAAKTMADRLMDKYQISASECVPATRRPKFTQAEHNWSARFWDEMNRQAQQKSSNSYMSCNCRLQWTNVMMSFATGPHHSPNCPMWAPVPPRTDMPPRARTTRKPPVKETTRMSHKDCDHEATPAAREKCRKERQG